MFQTEHPSGLSPDIFTHYFSHHSKEDLIFMSDNQNNIQLPEHGKLTIPMTNDYLFRALLQQNNKVLTGLIASLLHLSPEFPLPVPDWKLVKSDPVHREETPHIFRLQKEPLSMQVYHSQAPVHLQD